MKKSKPGDLDYQQLFGVKDPPPKPIPKNAQVENWACYWQALEKQRRRPGHENDPFLLPNKRNQKTQALRVWMWQTCIQARRLKNGEPVPSTFTRDLLDQMEAKLGKRFWEQEKPVTRLRIASEEHWAFYWPALEKQRRRPGHEGDPFLYRRGNNKKIEKLVVWMHKVRMQIAHPEPALLILPQGLLDQMEVKLGKRFWEKPCKKPSPRNAQVENWACYWQALEKQRRRPGHENDPFLLPNKRNQKTQALISWMYQACNYARCLENVEPTLSTFTRDLLDQMEAKLSKKFWEKGIGISTPKHGNADAESAHYLPVTVNGYFGNQYSRRNIRVSIGRQFDGMQFSRVARDTQQLVI